MSRESELLLVDLTIKAESRPSVSRALASQNSRARASLRFLLALLVMDPNGFLSFRASPDRLDPYSADDEDTVPALYGRWAEAEHLARWLRPHVEKGGRIVLHSCDADGATWGWEFDGRGRMRALGLVPVGAWEGAVTVTRSDRGRSVHGRRKRSEA